MKIIETELKDCYILEPAVHGDHRGYFMETMNEKTLRENGLDYHFVQDNESYSSVKGTLRGLHFQTEPFTQAKLVRCTEGSIYDVVVDLREGSPSYKKWIKVELSKDNKRQLLVPRGFAHGFVTLTDDVTFIYNCDNYYSKEHDGGFLWNDPEIGVDWGVENPVLSEKDTAAPTLSLSKASFKYRGGK